MDSRRHYTLRNMLSRSCIRLIEISLKAYDGIQVHKVQIGEIELSYSSDIYSEEQVLEIFSELGFPVVVDEEVKIVEQCKRAAIELIHFANNTNSLIRKSDYIAERLQIPYDKISKVFSRVTGTTLEKYIILLKIEKVKELLINNEYSLSEIAYMLDYSSVQYLSNQFKKITGLTVSEFKQNPSSQRIPLEDLI